MFEGSLWSYFAGAGWVVKLVMLLLAGASIASWAFIFQQLARIRTAKQSMEGFEQTFWSGGDLAALYAESVKNNRYPAGCEAVFQAGFREFLRSKQSPAGPSGEILGSAERSMRATRLREQDQLEWHLPFLATVGSAAPFVGIFGTVCGIMLTFRTLAHVEQATISMVAPGIAEALIATAMGLFAAIPAVVAYNRFTTDINRLLNRLDMFEEAFLNILVRLTRAPSSVKQEA